MCGRFSLYVAPEILEAHYNAHFEEYTKYESYNIAPSAMLPIITNEDAKLFQMVKWGLKPSWSKQKAGWNNTRVESIETKPYFGKVFEEKRCIIPTTGFYEWKKEKNGKKTPYFFKMKDQEIFTFAGLWLEGENEKKEKIKTFSIITTNANEIMSDVHDRMPVILSDDQLETWLGDDVTAAGSLLLPYDSDLMQKHIVSTKVNSPSNNSAELINSL